MTGNRPVEKRTCFQMLQVDFRELILLLEPEVTDHDHDSARAAEQIQCRPIFEHRSPSGFELLTLVFCMENQKNYFHLFTNRPPFFTLFLFTICSATQLDSCMAMV